MHELQEQAEVAVPEEEMRRERRRNLGCISNGFRRLLD